MPEGVARFLFYKFKSSKLTKLRSSNFKVFIESVLVSSSIIHLNNIIKKKTTQYYRLVLAVVGKKKPCINHV